MDTRVACWPELASPASARTANSVPVAIFRSMVRLPGRVLLDRPSQSLLDPCEGKDGMLVKPVARPEPKRAALTPITAWIGGSLVGDR